MKVLAKLDKSISSMVFTLSKDHLWDAATIELADGTPYYCWIKDDSSTACLHLSRNTSLLMPFSFFADAFVVDQELPDDYNYWAPDPNYERHKGLFYDVCNHIVLPMHYSTRLFPLYYIPVYQVKLPPAPLALRNAILDKLHFEQFVQLQEDKSLVFENGNFRLTIDLYEGQVFDLLEDPVKHYYEIDTGCVNLAFNEKLFGKTFSLLEKCPDGYQWDSSNSFWEGYVKKWVTWDENWEKIEKLMSVD